MSVSTLGMAGYKVASEAEVRRSMANWRMPDANYAAAKQWHEGLVNGSYFATGIMVPAVINGASGMLLAVSTPESTRVSKQNYLDNVLGRIISNPEWLYYAVWWYANLAFQNWSGITDAQYQGHEIGTLGDVLDTECIKHGMVDWTKTILVYRTWSLQGELAPVARITRSTELV